MKKVSILFSLAVAMIATMMSFTNSEKTTSKINAICESAPLIVPGHIEVSWRRGLPTVVGDKVECVGRGMCEMKIVVEKILTTEEMNSTAHSTDQKYAGFDARGNMTITVFNPKDSDFTGASFTMDGDVMVNAQLAKLLGAAPYTIKKGTYPITKHQNGKYVTITFPKI